MIKKIAISLLCLIPLLTLPLPVYASCFSPDGENICALAKEVVDLLQPRLPQKVNNEVTIITTAAESNTIIAKASVSFNKDKLEKTAVTIGKSPDEMIAVFSLITQKQTCMGNLRSLVDKGIHLRYEYLFDDMTPFTTLAIDNCTDVDSKELKF